MHNLALCLRYEKSGKRKLHTQTKYSLLPLRGRRLPTLESRVTFECAGMKPAPTWKMEWQTSGSCRLYAHFPVSSLQLAVMNGSRGLYARGINGQSVGNRNNLAAK